MKGLISLNEIFAQACSGLDFRFSGDDEREREREGERERKRERERERERERVGMFL